MKLQGFTDSQDWHPLTLLSMMADRECWECGVFWREWRLEASYTWYDGPLFHVYIGPLWIGLSTH